MRLRSLSEQQLRSELVKAGRETSLYDMFTDILRKRVVPGIYLELPSNTLRFSVDFLRTHSELLRTLFPESTPTEAV